MKFLSLVASAAVLITTNAASAALMVGEEGDGNPSLVYDPTTGSLSVQADGGDLALIEISSTGSLFQTGNAILPPGALATDTESLFGFSLFSGSFVTAGETFDLGPILPSGLTDAELLADLAGEVGFSPAASAPNASLDLISAIPEPTSVALLGLGVAGVIARRRRV